jgi:hypothetical protein
VSPKYAPSSRTIFEKLQSHKPMPDGLLVADAKRNMTRVRRRSRMEARAIFSQKCNCTQKAPHPQFLISPLLTIFISNETPCTTLTMLGLRNLARNAPRAAARLSTKAVRPQSSVFRQTAAFQPSWAASVPRLTASFHVSARRQESGAGTSPHKTGELRLTCYQSAMSWSQSCRARSPRRRT